MSVAVDKFVLDTKKRIYTSENGPVCVSIVRLTVRVGILVALMVAISYLCVQLFSDEPMRSTKTHHTYAHKYTGDMKLWEHPKLPSFINSMHQDDPRLIEYIRKYWIVPPSGKYLSLSNNHADVDRSQAGQSHCIDYLLQGKRNGFFVEAGAYNGEIFSNTLYLERARNWTGLLVEPSPDHFAEMLMKNRNAFMINACLSPTTHPMTVNFSVSKLMGAVEDYQSPKQMEIIHKAKRYEGSVVVQCFPIYSILKAVRASVVDYFSLDVVGLEYQVLKSLPLRDVDVKTFSIEYRIAKDKRASEYKMYKIQRHLEPLGYYLAGKLLRLDVVMRKTAKHEVKMRQNPVCFPQMDDEDDEDDEDD